MRSSAAIEPRTASVPLLTAFAVTVAHGDEQREYITVAHEISGAVAKALVALREQQIQTPTL